MECRILLLERYPLKYPIVRHIEALDLRNIAESPENTCEKFMSLNGFGRLKVKSYYFVLTLVREISGNFKVDFLCDP